MKLSSRFLCWSAAAVWFLGVAAAEDCNVGEEQLEFTFFLDEDSLTENGWTLACDDVGTIWNVPMGTLEASGSVQFSDTPFVKDQVCVSKNSTCHFTMEDLYGDGLLFPGYFFLTYGATTIVVSEEEEEFFEKASCIGPSCPISAQEVVEDCDDLYLFFQANSFPQESSVQIECDGEIKFAKSDFMISQEVTEFETCLTYGTCCNLMVYDSAFDGLQGGQVFLEWANQVIFSYDDSDSYEFGTISRSFGSGCSESIPDTTAQNIDGEPEENVDTPIVSTRSEGDEPSLLDETVDTIQEESSSMQKDPTMSTGVIVAMVVAGSLIVIGVIVLACSCPSSKAKSNGKDLEVRSIGSRETDLEEES